MRFKQRKRIVNLFITSHFSYYPLVWMFHNRRLINPIDHIHERAYQDFNSSFKELLRKRQLVNINFLIKCQKQKSFRILWIILLTREAATANVLHRPPPATLLKTRLWHRWFSVNFAKFLRICNDSFCIEIWQITCYLKDLKTILKTLQFVCYFNRTPYLDLHSPTESLLSNVPHKYKRAPCSISIF